jgi:hypothetical protein
VIPQSMLCRAGALLGGLAGGGALGRGDYAVGAVVIAGAVFLWFWAGRLHARGR